MTQTRTILALVFGLIAGLLLAAGIAQVSGQVTEAPAPAEITYNRIDAIPAEQPTPTTEPLALGTDFGLVHLAAGDADVTQAQVDEILLAADRVCEAMTAEVPMAEITRTLMDTQGLDGTTARDFADLVASTRC